jgi:chemotaxis protein MotB
MTPVPPAAPSRTQPIIIKRKAVHHGHHGGAWKVAYADFVTALMSLFIVLWLTSQSSKVKEAVAGYFNDPRGTSNQLGTTMKGTGVPAPVPATDLNALKDRLIQEIKASKNLEKLSKQIEITVTQEGLRIELLEGSNATFYESGSAHLSDNGQQLLALLAGELKTLPNHLLIEGHTDAAQYSTGAEYTNWELSADRANSARRLMQQDGVRTDQVTQVRGYADQMLRVQSNPFDPSNRRVTILVKNEAGAPARLPGSSSKQQPAPQAAQKTAPVPLTSNATVKPSATQPANHASK